MTVVVVVVGYLRGRNKGREDRIGLVEESRVSIVLVLLSSHRLGKGFALFDETDKVLHLFASGMRLPSGYSRRIGDT